MPQITRRQIKDGAINNSKVAAGAGIETTKLADGASFIKSDGTVAFGANQSMGNNRLTDVQTPSGTNDAASKGYVDSKVAAIESIFKRRSVRAASTANVTISSPGASIDGVSLSSGNRVLLKNQSSAFDNGIYVWTGAATPMARAADADIWEEYLGMLIHVQEGSTNDNTHWLSNANDGGELDVDNLTFTQQSTGGGLVNTDFVDKEVPAGTVNGVNNTFTLANTPYAGSEHFYINGILQEPGSVDYSISGTTITTTVAPETGDVLRVSYRKNV